MLPTSSFLIYCKHIVGQMPAVSPQTQTPLLNWLTHLNFNLDRYLIKAGSISPPLLLYYINYSSLLAWNRKIPLSNVAVPWYSSCI